MIQRKKPLQRSTKRIPARRTKQRRGPVGIPAEEWRNPNYRLFLAVEGKCVACVKEHPNWRWFNCDPCHTENNGMRSKGRDSSCAPLCRVHHQEYDAGRKAFEERYGIDMQREAAVWFAAWKIFKESQ